jgi:aminomethyltransferase
MHSRGQLARRIVGWRVDDDSLPVAGSPVLSAEGEQVGIVTSSTLSPVLSNVSIGLALVKKPHFSIGSRLGFAAEGSIRQGTVVETPFA